MRNDNNGLRTFMNKQDVMEMLRVDTDTYDKFISDKDIIFNIKSDYEDLIDLRNRIHDGTDNDTQLFEEDHMTLDHVLDYMQIFMKLIGMGD